MSLWRLIHTEPSSLPFFPEGPTWSFEEPGVKTIPPTFLKTRNTLHISHFTFFTRLRSSPIDIIFGEEVIATVPYTLTTN